MKNVRNRYVTLGDLQESGSRIISSSLVMLLSNLDVFKNNRRKYNNLFLIGSLLGLCVLTKMLLVRKGKIDPNILNVYGFTQGAVIGALVTTSVIDLAAVDKTKLLKADNLHIMIPRIVASIIFRVMFKNFMLNLFDPFWKFLDRLLGIPLYDEKTLSSAVNSIDLFDDKKIKHQISRMMSISIFTSVIVCAVIIYKYKDEISLSKLQEVIQQKDGITRFFIATGLPLVLYIFNQADSVQRTQRLNEFKQNLKNLIVSVTPKKAKVDMKKIKDKFMRISLLKNKSYNLTQIENSNSSLTIPVNNMIINKIDNLINGKVTDEVWVKVFTSIKDAVNVIGLEEFKSYISKIIIVNDRNIDNAFVAPDSNHKDKYIICFILGKGFSSPDVNSKHITSILLHEFGHIRTSSFLFFKVYMYLAYVSFGVSSSNVDISSAVRDFADAVIEYMAHVLGRLGEIFADSYAIRAGYGKYLAEILDRIVPEDYKTLHTLNNDVHGIPDERVKAIDKVADAILSRQ